MSRARLFLALGLVLLFVVPVVGVSVTITRPGGVAAPPGWDRSALAVGTRIELIASEPGGVAVSPPALVAPEVFDPARHITLLEGFTVDSGTGSLVSSGGGRLVIEGVFGDVNLEVEQGAGAGDVRITRTTPLGSQDQVLSSESSSESTPGWQRVDLPSPSSLLVSQRLSLLRPFSVPEDSAVSVGPRSVSVTENHVSVTALAATSLAAVAGGWLLVGIAVLVLTVCWAVGRLLLRRDEPPTAVALAFGFCLLGCLVNSLAYWLPLRWVVPVVVLLIALVPLLAMGDTAAPVRAAFGRGFASLMRQIGLVLVPTMLLFWPIFTWGPWFAGGYKTDLYEYASLSSLLPDHSMLSLRSLEEAQASGNITSGAGIVWRSIDSVTASSVSWIFGLPTLGGFVIVGVLLFLVFGVTVLAFADSRGWTGRIVALAALSCPLLTSLLLENYFSQYYFVALIPSFVLVLAWLLTREDSAPAHTWALASAGALMIAVYPYFFAIVVAACSVVLAFSRGLISRLRRLALPLAVKTALLTNLALLPVLNYGQTERFEAGLDRIARDWLLGPWDGVEVAQALLGVRSYHWREPLQTVDGLGQSLQALLDYAGNAVVPSVAAAVIVALIVIVAAILGFRFSGHRLETRLMSAIIVAFVTFGLAYALRDHPYVMLKSLWVAAALVPLVIVGLSTWRRVPAIPIAVTAALAMIWTATVVADRTAWVLPLNGSLDRSLHVSAVPDLQRLEDDLEQGDSNPAVMVPGQQPLAGSDRDRVLSAFTVVLFRDADVECLTCLGTEVPESSACPTEPAASGATIGADARPDLCGLPERSEGSFQDLYGAR